MIQGIKSIAKKMDLESYYPIVGYFYSFLYYGSAFKCIFCHANLRKFSPFGFDLPEIKEQAIVGGGLRNA